MITSSLRIAVCVAGTLSFSQAANGQELSSLYELIENGAEETYPLVRCAGLYLSGLEWAGEDVMGPDATEETKLIVYRLLTLATEMRAPSLGENAEGSALRDVRSVSDLYLERYAANYASVGKAFEDDPVWASDVEVCGLLLGSPE